MLGASDPGCRRGIHVGSARDGKVKYFDRTRTTIYPGPKRRDRRPGQLIRRRSDR